jgi:hypothetical protein
MHRREAKDFCCLDFIGFDFNLREEFVFESNN